MKLAELELLRRLSLRMSASQIGISARGVRGVDVPEDGLSEGSNAPLKGPQPVGIFCRLKEEPDAMMLAFELEVDNIVELEADRARSTCEDDEGLLLDSTGRLRVRTDALRRGSDLVGRGGDILLFCVERLWLVRLERDLVIPLLPLNEAVACVVEAEGRLFSAGTKTVLLLRVLREGEVFEK